MGDIKEIFIGKFKDKIIDISLGIIFSSLALIIAPIINQFHPNSHNTLLIIYVILINICFAYFTTLLFKKVYKKWFLSLSLILFSFFFTLASYYYYFHTLELLDGTFIVIGNRRPEVPALNPLELYDESEGNPEIVWSNITYYSNMLILTSVASLLSLNLTINVFLFKFRKLNSKI